MKRLIRIFCVLIFFAGIIAFIGYQKIFGINTLHNEEVIILIPKNSNFDDVIRVLDTAGIVKKMSSFRQVSSWMKYGPIVKSGRYKVGTNLNNRELVGLLRSGRQEPVQLTISAARRLQDIAGIVAKKIEADSVTILNTMSNEELLHNYNLNPHTAISLFIPNTYELYWNITAEQFLDRMHKEYLNFWSRDNRLQKLETLNLSKSEVATIASIVEKESIQKDERPTIAGLYLNRIVKGIPLQADPTVVFGVGDFTIRRVLNKHLAFDSPYNTYMYPGIPPGPICMPSISSIDAVLNPEKHDYLFMCAKPGYNGSHSFATNTADHERNARVYRRWLNSEGIRG